MELPNPVNEQKPYCFQPPEVRNPLGKGRVWAKYYHPRWKSVLRSPF